MAEGLGVSSGTVTFLFTDIEGSTRRWQDDEAAMALALEEHDARLTSIVVARGGVVFKHTGDGVCAVFSSARHAVAAAVAARGALALPVRMGLHTGEAQRRNDDFFGPVLNRTTRIMAAGHGGQILVSGATAALVDAAVLVDLGEHRLRDLTSPEHLWQVGTGVFPALRTLSTFRTNVPAELSSFIGRRVELGEVADLLGAHRLVTLTGVGGAGKTRLALQVAATARERFPDGVWLVELGSLVEPSAIAVELLAALGAVALAGQAPLERAKEFLTGRRALLILDNCEHLLDAVAELVAQLLVTLGGLSILATSREALSMRGEHTYGVRSMAAGPDDSGDAVDLFVERVREERPGFALTDANRDTISLICSRLDGLPLAIELAAARAQVMDVHEIADRLDERFRLLTGDRRGRVERHKTLRTTVDWSFEQLLPEEQEVFARLSVFAGSFDLGAAIAVCATGQVDEFAVLDRIGSLVAKSMVNVEDHPRLGTRYRLLETLRDYGHEHLARTDGVDDARSRHASHYANRTSTLMSMFYGIDTAVVLDTTVHDAANYRAAVNRLKSTGEVDALLRLCGFTAAVAIHRGWWEPHHRLIDALAQPGVERSPCWPFGLGVLATTTFVHEVDLPKAERLALASVASWTNPATPDDLVRLGEFILSCIELVRGQLERAYDWAAQLEINGCQQPASFERPYGLFMMSISRAFQGRTNDALTLAEELDRHFADHPHGGAGYHVHHAFGFALMANDPARAIEHFDLASATGRAVGSTLWERNAAVEAMALRLDHTNNDAAAGAVRDMIGAMWEARDLGNMARVVSYAVVVCVHAARYVDAAQIEGWHGDRGRSLIPADLARYEQARETLDHELGALAETLRAQGAQRSAAAAIEHLLTTLDTIATST